MENEYNAIAQSVARAAPQGWKKLWITARVGDDFAETQYDFEDDSGDVRWFGVDESKAAYEIGDALISIRQKMRQGDKEPWSRAIFTLMPDGKFNLEVSYDD